MLNWKSSLIKNQNKNMNTETVERGRDIAIALEGEVMKKLVIESGDDPIVWIDKNNCENPVILRRVISEKQIQDLINSGDSVDYERAVKLAIDRFNDEKYPLRHAA